MKPPNRTILTGLISAVALVGTIGVSVMVSGQAISQQRTGVPDDWSHHHLVFSSPGTFTDALKNGTLAKWNQITNNPRYQMQQLKRDLLQRQLAAAPDFAARTALVNAANAPLVRRPRPRALKKPLKKDWSMDMAAVGASGVGTVTTNNASTSPQSNVTVDGQTILAGAPSTASASAAFTANPTASQTLLITNGSNSETLTASGTTYASATGTFTANPSNAQTARITNGANSETLTATAALFASDTGTFTGNPTSGQTVTIGGSETLTASDSTPAGASITIGTSFCFPPNAGVNVNGTAFTTNATVGTGTFTVSTTAAPANHATVIIGGVTYTFETTLGGTTANQVLVPGGTWSATKARETAENLAVAINNSGTCGYTAGGVCTRNVTGANAQVSSSNNASNSQTMTARCAGNAQITNTGATNVTVGNVAAASSQGTNSASGLTFAIGTNTATATNIYNDINGNSTTSAILTATNPSSGVVNLVAKAWGTSGNSYTLALTNAAATGVTLAGFSGGTNGTNTGTSFAIDSVAADAAANLAAAITRNGAGVGVSATASGATVTVTATTAGTAGNNIKVVNNLTGFSIGNTLAGGAGLQTGTGYFAITDSSGNALVTSSVAANLATALTSSAVGVTGSSSGAVVTVRANALGASGNNVTLTNVNLSNFAWSSGNLAGGATLQTGPGYFAFTDSSGNALTTTQTASNLAAAITNAAVGVTGSSSGAQLTITAKTAGSTGNNITLTNGLSNLSLPSTLSGGSDGAQDGTHFAYWSGAAVATPAQLAANIAASINANSTLKSAVSAESAGNLVYVTADAAGTGGDSIGTSVSNFSGFEWGGTTLANGGTSAGGTVGAGMYPAKYSFSDTAANCDDSSTPDYVVFNTGLPGSSTQPTIVAYDNLYSGCSAASVPTPNIYWQYDTGGTISTNVVLSWDGGQVGFVQSSGTTASLVLLKWAKDLNLQQPASVSISSYRTCTAPCMTTITFNGAANDTMSSPYYDYSSDTMYVGDDAGKLHKFTGVFWGTPGEATSPWPVTVSSANKLTSAVYDLTSGLVFVADNGSTAGYLYSVSPTGAVVKSLPLGISPGMTDGPLVDGVTEQVYTVVPVDTNTSTSNSCQNAAGCNGVFQLPATFTATTKWNESVMGVATTHAVYIGAFDNQYYTSENSSTTPTGNLYVCGTYGGAVNEPKLMDAIITNGAFVGESGTSTYNATNGTVVFATNIARPMASASASCSPVTEYYNSTTGTDYIYLSVTGSGNLVPTGGNSCTGACLYSWNTTNTLAFQGTGTTITQPLEGLAAAGGTSGIIIDNSVNGEGAQVYFAPLVNQACAGNANGEGAGTGACAVQASQAGLQ